MHELSLAESIVDILRDGARAHGYSRVKAVWLEIGKLSHVEAEAMRFCFDVTTRGTLAEGARLEIVETPGLGVCVDCGREVEIDTLYSLCPACGSGLVQVTGGTDMRVKELEVE